MAKYDKEHCCLCLEEFSDKPKQQVLSKGLNNLIRISEEQEKTDLTVYLENFKHSEEVLYVHKDCRHKFTDTRPQSTMSVPAKKLFSSMSVAFEWIYFCFFCSPKVDFRNKDRKCLQDVMIWLQSMYHSACMTKFSKKTNSGKDGHPINEEKVRYFEMLCEW